MPRDFSRKAGNAVAGRVRRGETARQVLGAAMPFPAPDGTIFLPAHFPPDQ
jgi:hypothetical protein